MQKNELDPRKQEIVSASHRILTLDQLSQLGEPNELLSQIGTQVSDLIAQQNREHPSSMLPKTPEDVISQFLAGHSVVIFSLNSPLTVLYHGAIYPNFTPKVADYLGIQVAELGSAISHPGYRDGYGLGSEGSKLRVQLAANFSWDTLCLSTNKDGHTSRVLQHADMSPDDYWKYPYLTYLTCTCTNCSEAHGFSACPFRRSPGESTPDKLAQILDRDLGIRDMPCTLILSDPSLALGFERKCRELHTQLGGTPLLPGTINIGSMQSAAEFFDKVTSYANQ